MKRNSITRVFLIASLSACGGDEARTDAQYQEQITSGMRSYLNRWVDDWLLATKDLQAAAPVPGNRGWDAAQDAAAITAMKEAWIRARVAYEHIEGVLAPFFPDRDVATDARYDDYLDALKPAGDAYLFDGTGVTGMHGIERILFASTTPLAVVTFEKPLPGYVPASVPATAQEAADFKHKLAAQLVADVQGLREELRPIKFDLAAAFNGVIDLVAEQLEKVDKAATGQEESRYAQMTMRDLRSNHQGASDFYALFRPWLLSRGNAGVQADAKVAAGFARLKLAYDAVPGDAIPTPPATWSALAPTAEDRATSFGVLWTAVNADADEAVPGTLATDLVAAVELLGWKRAP